MAPINNERNSEDSSGSEDSDVLLRYYRKSLWRSKVQIDDPDDRKDDRDVTNFLRTLSDCSAH